MNWDMEMTEQRPLGDEELEILFAAARQLRPLPSNDLIKRILEDSERPADAVVRSSTTPRRGVLDALPETIRGIPAALGLAGAAVAGLAIGFFAAVPLDSLPGMYLDSSADFSIEDIIPSFFDLIEV